jgi:hypothetical protein
LTIPYFADPISDFLRKYYQNLQQANAPTAADATATRRRGPAQPPPQGTIGPQSGVRAAHVLTGPLGALMSVGEGISNQGKALVQRAQAHRGYPLSDAFADIGRVTGVTKIAGGIRNADAGAIGSGLLDAALSVAPELKGEEVATKFAEVAPEQFHSALSSFAKQRPHEAGFITWRSPEEMRAEQMRTFVSPDQKTGYAVHPASGDIRNVFNHGAPGAGAHAIADAIGNGGKVLDAFDTNLGNFYRDFGFKESSRVPWDEQYAPEGWNRQKYGTPDVIGMEHPLAGGQTTADQLLGQYAWARGERKVIPARPRPRMNVNRDVTPGNAAFRDPPTAVKARIADAWEILNRPMPPSPGEPPGKLVDRSLIKPDEGPTLAPLPTREAFGPRASSGHMTGVNSDENLALIKAQAGRGLRMMPPTFYPSVKAVHASIEHEGGSAKLFNDATTAAAIRNGVPGELVGGTAMLWALKQGIITPEEMLAAANKGGKNAFQDLGAKVRSEFLKKYPDANGLQLFGNHVQAFRQRLVGEAPNAYKIPQYGAQKEGDVAGSVLDTHEGKGGTLASPFNRLFADQGGFSNPEYGRIEPLYRYVAQHMGVSDRTLQEARWRGGGDITGLRTPPNMDYAHIFENMLLENAQYRNINPRGLLRGVARGEEALYFPKKAK